MRAPRSDESESEEESSAEEVEDEELAEKKRKKEKKRARVPKQSKAKRKSRDSDSEDDSDLDDFCEDDLDGIDTTLIIKSSGRGGRSTRARKAVKYTYDSPDEEEEW